MRIGRLGIWWYKGGPWWWKAWKKRANIGGYITYYWLRFIVSIDDRERPGPLKEATA